MKPKPNFEGHWVCSDTWGLDEFLAANRASTVQRFVATKKASWPSWHFEQQGGHFIFTNHSMLGDVKEEFDVDGAAYVTVDGMNQKLDCKAYWEEDVLVIDRSGPQGVFRERRLIDENGMLHFKLTGLSAPHRDISWGRTFQRKSLGSRPR